MLFSLLMKCNTETPPDIRVVFFYFNNSKYVATKKPFSTLP